MGYMHSPDCTLTKLRTPESPRSSSCVISPYSTLPMPAHPYPFSDAPKNPSSAMGLTSSRGKRPARLHSSIIGIRLSSMNWRVVSRTSFSSSVSRESYCRKSTPRNLMAGMEHLRHYKLWPSRGTSRDRRTARAYARKQTNDGSRTIGCWSTKIGPQNGGAPHGRAQSRMLGSSAPALKVRPQVGPGIKFFPFADEDWNLLFKRPIVWCRRADVLHIIPITLQYLFAVVEDDHAIAGVVVRAPDPIGAVAAHGPGEAFTAAEEVDRAGLPVVLRKDAAVRALGCGDTVPGHCRLVGNLLPPKLIRVPLRQCCSGVVMLIYRKLHRQGPRIREELVGSENWNGDGHQVEAIDRDHYRDHRLQPCATRGKLARVKCDRTGGKQHWVDRRQVVVLAVLQINDGVAHQVTPAEDAIRPQRTPEQQREKPGQPNHASDRIYFEQLLKEKLERPPHHIAALRPNGADQLQKWPVIVPVPQHIR